MSDLVESAREILREAHQEINDVKGDKGPADVRLARYGAVIQAAGKALGLLRVEGQQREVPEREAYEKFAIDLVRYTLIHIYWLHEHTKMAEVPPRREWGSAAITQPDSTQVDLDVQQSHKSIDDAWADYYNT